MIPLDRFYVSAEISVGIVLFIDTLSGRLGSPLCSAPAHVHLLLEGQPIDINNDGRRVPASSRNVDEMSWIRAVPSSLLGCFQSPSLSGGVSGQRSLIMIRFQLSIMTR